MTDQLTIGELSVRSGVAQSALRFYETQGLISSQRTSGGQRRYTRAILRRVAFVRAAQRVGLSLEQIRSALDGLPDGRTPTRSDWAKLSQRWQGLLDKRIGELEDLRDNLTGCIGCGCLSLQRCRLYNPDDRAGADGPGPRYLAGDSADPATTFHPGGGA